MFRHDVPGPVQNRDLVSVNIHGDGSDIDTYVDFSALGPRYQGSFLRQSALLKGLIL